MNQPPRRIKTIKEAHALLDTIQGKPSPDTHTTSEQIDEIVDRIANANKIAINEVAMDYMIIPNAEKRADEIVAESKPQLQKLLDEASIRARLDEDKLLLQKYRKGWEEWEFSLWIGKRVDTLTAQLDAKTNGYKPQGGE